VVSSNGSKSDERQVWVKSGPVMLQGVLHVPVNPQSIVLFAHGSESTYNSPRNLSVVRTLSAAGLATLLIDLLTPDEDASDQQKRRLRFDIRLLSKRLYGVIDWLLRQPETQKLQIGCFGVGTSAAAALVAAADHPELISAIVSRGGRPDLAGPALPRVGAPTLLIVGEKDLSVLALNRAALAALTVEKRLMTIPGATHLFEEPSALEQTTCLALQWFNRYLALRDTTAGAKASLQPQRSQRPQRG
jgi:dienelactone hydrolase